MPPEYSAKLMKNRENKITHEAKKDIHEKDQVYLTQAYNAACELSKEYNWYEIKCVKDGKIRTIQDINDEIFTEVKKTHIGGKLANGRYYKTYSPRACGKIE